MYFIQYVDGLVQDCSISIANTLDILQSCTKPLMRLLCCIYSFPVSKWDMFSGVG